MKIAFDSTYHWDFDAPTLPAELVEVNGAKRLRVWCDHCHRFHFHFHGPRPGHRESHCHDPESPYERSGYNLEMSVE